jgi:hypothetical protein
VSAVREQYFRYSRADALSAPGYDRMFSEKKL